jgi:hypothetical protein
MTCFRCNREIADYETVVPYGKYRFCFECFASAEFNAYIQKLLGATTRERV